MDKTKDVVEWKAPDLAYMLLADIRRSVSYYAGSGDLEGWHNALEEEYRFVWALVKDKARSINPLHTRAFFDKTFQDIWHLLHDPRYELDNFASDRLKQSNYSKARTILHNLHMTLYEYEVKANLHVTMGKWTDPGKALARYG